MKNSFLPKSYEKVKTGYFRNIEILIGKYLKYPSPFLGRLIGDALGYDPDFIHGYDDGEEPKRANYSHIISNDKEPY